MANTKETYSKSTLVNTVVTRVNGVEVKKTITTKVDTGTYTHNGKDWVSDNSEPVVTEIDL